MELNWKVSKEDDNSGVFVCFPDPNDDAKIPVKRGYEIQIDDAAGNPLHQTGATTILLVRQKLFQTLQVNEIK